MSKDYQVRIDQALESLDRHAQTVADQNRRFQEHVSQNSNE